MREENSSSNIFFSLDVGTRDVIGVIGKQENSTLVITNVVTKYHRSRAMYDGQVHDIQAVADVVSEVKSELEQQTGIKLTEVAVAAAGRSLKTIQITSDVEFDSETQIDSKTMRRLEMQVLQNASAAIKENVKEGIPFYNVGHTIMNYKLDDYEIKNPEGQKGKKLSCEVIATFLPKVVIEALDSVVKRAGLNIAYMDLEPVVALEVTVPENVRLLNIAMVDVGAGTSDIAVSREGTIIGYDMTSTAGDEITEALSREYLLDFDTAEKLKCSLMSSSNQSFTDIVGSKIETTSDEILDRIQDSIKQVAKNIADGILKVNGKSPSAVFLVGGGSQVPTLDKYIAEDLDLPEERVVIKNAGLINEIQGNDEFLSSPQSITPVGLLKSCIKNHSRDFIEVTVNNENIKMLRSSGLKVGDALILSGFDPKELIARRGKSLLLYVNGEEKLYKSDYGTESEIMRNAEPTGLSTLIKDDDEIFIQPATRGKDVEKTLGDIVGNEYVYFEDKKIPYAYDITINAVKVSDTLLSLQNGDRIEFDVLDTVGKFKDFMNLHDYAVCVNDKLSMDDGAVNPGDKLSILDLPDATAPVSNKITKKIDIIFNGENVTIESSKQTPIFVDIFDFVKFDRTKISGKNLITNLNGKRADYTSPIKDGDDIEVYWEK